MLDNSRQWNILESNGGVAYLLNISHGDVHVILLSDMTTWNMKMLTPDTGENFRILHCMGK